MVGIVDNSVCDAINSAPTTFGVYAFLDKTGKPIYIGKARNLRRRLSQYLRPEANTKMQAIRNNAYNVTWNLCNSQTEALLLEAQKVHALQPKYNILLKDDKSMPGIVIDTSHDFPAIRYQRKPSHNNVKYYGPFSDATAVKNVINTVRKIYRLRNCSDVEFKTRKKPCLEYQIKRCSAPCVNMITQTDYQQQIKVVRAVLTGNQKHIRGELITAMERYAENMDFEKAANIRDRISALTLIAHHAKQYSIQGNMDIIILAREDQHCSIQISYIRNSGSCGNDNFYLKNTFDEDIGSIMNHFIAQFYIQQNPPERIVVNHEPNDIESIQAVLQTRVGCPIAITTMDKHKEASIYSLITDTEMMLKQYIKRKQLTVQKLMNLREKFMLPKIPNHIEVFDNSHISGSNAIGVMIVASKGIFVKKKYRKYNFKTTFKAADDYAMMREMLTRRLSEIQKHLKAESMHHTIPDLWLVDGGATHLSVAQSVMAELQIYIPCICIAKGPQRNAGNEEFFSSTLSTSMRLPRNDPMLFYMQTLRDEAHRFAITSHRNKRQKESTVSILEQIHGIGPKRKLVLLRYFGSVDAIKNASVNAIMHAPGIDATMAHIIYDFFRNNS